MALKRIGTTIGPWERALLAKVHELGGWKNYHAHFDRSDTLDPEFYGAFDITPIEDASIMSLHAKQQVVGELHRGLGYKNRQNLESRLWACVKDAIAQGSRKCVTFIDATPDVSENAPTPIEIAAKIRKEAEKKKFELRIAAHPIFGFKEDQDFTHSRWEIFKSACQIADVVGALPEKDDRPDSVGYDEHMRRTLELAIDLKKPYHAHVDQANLPTEQGTKKLIEAVRWLGSPKIDGRKEPTVWAIHAISPSSYSEDKFQELVEGLVKYDIGVICCPSAALSMRQLRNVAAPTHNSIARALEMALAGVSIRIGTDNLSDIFVPTYVTMLDEVKVLANAVRFYNIPVLAKFAGGIKLNQTNKDAIKRHLEAAAAKG